MEIDFANVTEVRFCTTCKSKTTHEKKLVKLMDTEVMVCTECDTINSGEEEDQ